MATVITDRKSKGKVPEIVEMGKETVLTFDPDDPNLIVDPKDNGRFMPYEREDVADLIPDIASKGIIHNLEARPAGKNAKGEPMYRLTLGFRRQKAASIVKAEKLTPYPIRIPVKIAKVDEKTAFYRNVSENLKRRPPTVIDNAHNISRMLAMNSTMQEITAEYGQSPAWVTETLKALNLSYQEQVEYHKKKLNDSLVVFLADKLPDAATRTAVLEGAKEEAQDEIVKQAAKNIDMDVEEAKRLIADTEKENPKATPEVIEEVVAKKARAKGLPAAAAKKLGSAAKKKQKPEVNLKHAKQAAEKAKAISDVRSRKVSDIKEFLDEMGAPGRTGVPAPLKKMMVALYEWIDGQLGTEDLKERLKRPFAEAA